MNDCAAEASQFSEPGLAASWRTALTLVPPAAVQRQGQDAPYPLMKTSQMIAIPTGQRRLERDGGTPLKLLDQREERLVRFEDTRAR